MAYSIPDCFMIAFAAGLIFAVVYEILRIVRVMFPFQVVTFVCDIVFFAGAVTKLSLSLGNYIRIYTVLGFGAGIFTYITTLGRLLNIVENAVAGAVRSALSAVFRFFGRIFGRLFGAIAHVWAGVFGEINKICLIAEKKLRKPLQKKVKIVYNKENIYFHEIVFTELRSYEATTPRRKHSILKMLAFTAGIMVAVFVVVSIVSTNISISNYEQQYDDLVAQTSAVEDSNDEIRRYLDEDADMDEYIEDMARSKLDFAMPDERVYYVVPDSGRSQKTSEAENN